MTHFLPPVAPRVGEHGNTLYDGISYRLVPGHRPLLLDLHVPDGPGPHPVVVWLHGGGFIDGDRRYLPSTLRAGSLFEALLDAGLAVATADYRLSGEARFPAQREDVRAAIGYLRHHADQLGLDPERVGVAGESAGASLAGCVGLQPPARVAAAALWYPPTRLGAAPAAGSPAGRTHPVTALLGGSPAERPDVAAQLNLVDQVTPAAPPFLLIHGTADVHVPHQHSERLHESLLAAGCSSTYLPVADAGHCFAGHDDIAGLITTTARFLAEHLHTSRPPAGS